MTITVTADKIGGSFGLTANGPTATRVFLVETTAQETMDAILQDANIPSYYDSYTYSGSNYAPIFALEISCQPHEDQNGVYLVTVNYGRPDQSQADPGTDPEDSVIHVGASVTSTKTAKDNAGNRITVSLTGQPTQTGEVEIQVPETVLVFERRESASPLTKALANVGRVNSVDLATSTYPAHTLLCLGIEGVSTDYGETWQVTYRFQYRPDTWAATVLYIDPETDRPHDDINLGTSDGVTTANVYPEVDFTILSLPWA